MSRYIDADLLINVERAVAEHEWNKKTRPLSWSHATESFIEDIENAPTADVEEVIHSEWLPSPDGINPIRCKRCNTPAPYVFVSTAQGDTELIRYKFNFCPYCGAKMDGGKE